jgi:predicted lipoprotein with Yx(FWY)xxD motif
MKKNSTRSTLTLLVIFLLVALAACSPNTNPAANQANPQTQPATAVTTGNANPSVTVKDQVYDGTTIVVADAVSPGPGWMVIHNQENGALGPPIGETQINGGENKDIVVKIDPAQATDVMYAMLHQDGGTVGKYEFPGPDVPVMIDGVMLAPAFNATVHSGTADITPLIKVTDQDIAAGKVTIASIASSGPGWVTVNVQGADGSPGSEIGYTAVKSGSSENVVITVDASKATPVLFVMLYQDAGESGKYEIPDPDAPQQANGQAVSASFKTEAAGMVMDTPAAGGYGSPATAAPVTPGASQPSITVSDQPIQNGTVTVSQVVTNGNWWLVIHKQNPNGEMGEYIGATLLPSGVSNNVVVEIDENRATPVLYAMLHEDLGESGKLQFPGPDLPVMVNGEMLTPSFHLISPGQGVTINIRTLPNSVAYLTDGQGKSLYSSLQDTPGKSNCTGACLTVWKPLLATGRIVPGAGVQLANLGVITLPDGTRQITYLSAPLYTYSGDTNPGDINGQGADGAWFLVTP